MNISVIIPVFNAEKSILNAVESALQFEEVYEVILVEDESGDNSLEICRRLEKKYEKVSVFQHMDGKNHGAGLSRNLGIEFVLGDFIAFLNADDYYLPSRFDAEKKLFSNPEVDGVYGATGIHYYSEKAKEQYYPIYGEYLTTIHEKCPPEFVFPGQMKLGSLFGDFSINAVTIRKDRLLEKMSVFFKPIQFHGDKEFLLRLSFYLNLYSGILNKPIAMQGVYEYDGIDFKIPEKTSDRSKVFLWEELHNWANKEDLVPKEMKIHTRRMYKSFKIANAPLLKRWAMVAYYMIVDSPCIRLDVYNANFINSLGI
ncbi:glycosyltransferase family 2 protein [Chryseobacterium sp. ISL-6]|uniref:glycosyltransferase family 2 protein n=1 Tax=Chryseobacterium sp. ISL-6 TaxID=2819143 RepID=UPI001BEAE76D|nr:glycosyltransferase family 2 protein [Chryseobacterium sp. ISL-6]MBT2623673.1 glycosyltransferase family 2 protein [Chryseobacterium sp. ISL-6]